MGNVNTLLNERFKNGERSSKMAVLAKQSASGGLTSFAGIFSVTELSPQEKESIELLLKEYSTKDSDFSEDLQQLISITSEVKAINNQAAILHGERIKKAHTILTKYRDGAFTTWLISAYGNRQTPYNLMQYYEFHEKLPKSLKPQIDLMPRQAVYTLATRKGPFDKKQLIVENYKNQTKQELLQLIRKEFPLPKKDKRRQNEGENLIQTLQHIQLQLNACKKSLSKQQKTTIVSLLNTILKTAVVS